MAPPPPPAPASHNPAAPPLEMGTLVQVLQAALDQNPERRQPAEAVLQAWEPLPNYLTSLHSVVRESGGVVDDNARFLAAVCLKNCVTRWWKRRAAGGVSEEEKTVLRAGLVTRLEMLTHLQITKQQAMTVAKIARNDWPDAWPALFPDLLSTVRATEGTARTHALLFLYAAVKEISAKVVGPTRRHLQEATPQMFPFLLELWTQSSAAAAHAHSPEAAHVSLLTLKVLRKLTCFGVARIDCSPDVATMLQAVLARLDGRAAALAAAEAQGSQECRALEIKSLNKMSVLVNEAQHQQPLPFAAFLPAFLRNALASVEQAAATLSGGGELAEHEERLTTRALLLVNATLLCSQYRAGHKPRGAASPAGGSPDHGGGSPRPPPPSPESVDASLREILSPTAVAHLTSILLSALFPMQASDLAEWEGDPEAFAHQELEEENLRLRQTAETVYCTLMQQRTEVACQVTLDALNHTVAMPLDAALPAQAVLQRDALYNAVGLCAYELQDHFSFGSWFRSRLVHELHGGHPLQRVMRRRVAMLIGAWSDAFADQGVRVEAYAVLLELLRDADMAVRVNACEGLLKLVDDLGFHAEPFAPHLVPAVTALFDLFAAAVEVDTKLRVLNALSILMANMPEHIRPVVNGILQMVPRLWEEAQHEHLMKGAVLVTITRLVQALGPAVTGIESFVVGVIQYSADVTQEHELYTLEDGLDLWLAVLRNSPAPTPALLALLPLLVPVLERDFERLQACLHILESYLLLYPAELLAVHGQAVAAMLHSVLGNVKDAGALMAVQVLDTMLVVCPEGAAQLLAATPLGHKALSMALSGEESHLVSAALLALLARLCFHDPPRFLATLEQAAARGLPRRQDHADVPPAAVWVDCCIDNVDHLMLPRKRRLVCAGLLALVATRDAALLQRVPAIVNVVVEVLHQERKETILPSAAAAAAADRDFSEVLSRELGEYDCTALEPLEQEAESVRLRVVEPAATLEGTALTEVARARLAECAALNGPAVYAQVLEAADPDVLQQLQRFMA